MLWRWTSYIWPGAGNLNIVCRQVFLPAHPWMAELLHLVVSGGRRCWSSIQHIYFLSFNRILEDGLYISKPVSAGGFGACVQFGLTCSLFTNPLSLPANNVWITIFLKWQHPDFNSYNCRNSSSWGRKTWIQGKAWRERIKKRNCLAVL